MKKIHQFREITAEKVANAELGLNLHNSLKQSNMKRAALIRDPAGWEENRERASSVRAQVLENLHDYLKEFTEHAEQNGIEVLWATDAEDANRQIVTILNNNGVRKVVKSKSMVTEEIELNKALSHEKIPVVETDLGEYIIQISGQKPSHITAPIIHMNRNEVGRIFQEKLNIPFSNDPETLTKIARHRLRREFLDADAGISGVNFGLVKEGGIVVVENEGNARLSMSLPKIHIAVMGLERLLPSIHHLPLFLKLLTVSATGQKITNYVSVITSPRRENEVDGPEKMYIVIIDNGRTALWQRKNYRSILKCIRCGACLNVCPVYHRIGGHAYGSVYPGPLGAVLSPLLFSMKEYAPLPFASSLCGACTDVCPVKIPLHHFLLDLRADIVESHLNPSFEKLFFRSWAAVMVKSTHYRFCEKILRYGQPLFPRDSEGLRVPRWSKSRFFPKFASRSFNEQMRNVETKTVES